MFITHTRDIGQHTSVSESMMNELVESGKPGFVEPDIILLFQFKNAL